MQHEHGRGADAPGIYVHDTRAADRDGLRAGDGNLCTRIGAGVNHEPASHYKDMTKTLLDLHRIEGLLPITVTITEMTRHE